MKVAFVADKSHQAPVYYRTIQFLPALAEAGGEAKLIPLPPKFYDRYLLFKSLRNYDLVILQRRLLNFVHFIPLRLFAKRLAFDVDDALFLKDSRSAAYSSPTLRSRFRRTVKSSDYVICGNEWLRDAVRPLNPRAEVIPTVVDLDAFGRPKEHAEDASFRIVWIGSRSTLFYLERILPALEPLKEAIRGLKLRVISDQFPDASNLPLERVPWSREMETQILQGGDAGLAPLEEDDWSRGKCGLKLLQYGAAGLPSIGSPVGVNELILEHGRTGFLARTAAEWRDAVLDLAGNVERRSKMGAAARSRVAEHFSLDAWRDRYVRLIRRLASTPP